MINKFYDKFKTSSLLLKPWLILSLEVVIVLTIIVLTILIFYRYNYIFDFSPSKEFTLSDQSKKILMNLKEDVKVIVFYEKGKRATFDHSLRLYTYVTPKFDYMMLNLDKNPAMAKKYGISSYNDTVVLYQQKREKIPYPNEEQIINAIIRLTSDREKKIYFVSGHGENSTLNKDGKTGYSDLGSTLEKMGYTVNSISLLNNMEIPSDACLLVISGPQKDYMEVELKAITEFLRQGGKTLFMIDPVPVPNLENFLSHYGMVLKNDIVVDKSSRLFGGDSFTPIAPLYNSRHPITELLNIGSIFPLCRSINFSENADNNNFGISIVKTDPKSWAAKDRDVVMGQQQDIVFQKGYDKEGPISIAVVAEGSHGEDRNISQNRSDKIRNSPENWSMVVFGDSDFANNFYLNVLGNKDLIISTITWLAEERSTLSISSTKSQEGPVSIFQLSAKQDKMIFWAVVVILPGILFIISIFLYIRRRLRG